MQDSFYNTGDYFLESGVEKLPTIEISKSSKSLLNFILWHTSTMIILQLSAVYLLYNGHFILFTLLILAGLMGKV